jgi:multifunctional 2-oxoglutarate metabolism enzyme
MADATTTVQVQMPQMGESVTEGTVLEWHVKEGDFVEEGDTLVEVSTDKVDAEVPAPSSGTVTKILVQPDDVVEIGAVLAELDPSGESAESPDAPGGGAEEAAGDDGNGKVDTLPPEEGDIAEGSAPAVEDQQKIDQDQPAGSPAAPGRGAEEAAGSGSVVEVQMPQMGESVNEGTILEWHKSEGESVEEGETLVEVSTDKVDAEVPAPVSGTLTKILAQPDETVNVGAVLAEITAGAAAGDGAGASQAQPATSPDERSRESGIDSDTSAKATPVARRAAAASGVDLGKVKGSGVGGRITKADVLRTGPASGKPSAGLPQDGAALKPIRGPAAMLAQAMSQSLTVPTATSFRTQAVDTLDAKRKALNAALKERGMKVSFTHLIAWAIVKAATEFPAMSRTYEEREGKPYLVDHGQVNLGIAVDVEKKDGSRTLMVPCIKGADKLDFAGFHTYYEELITKTRENKLTADDFAGTNITLTNPGGLGTIASVPRLMKGQGTIVATGSITYPQEWLHASPDTLKSLGVSKVMTTTSTYDHRIIQGAESGSFLRRIEQLIQGEDAFYESVCEDLGISPSIAAAAQPVSLSAPPMGQAPAAAPTLHPAAPSQELLQGVQAATSLLKAYRTHGHLAAKIDPLGSVSPGDPAMDPQNLNLTPELMAQIPAQILRIGVAGDTLLEALPRMREAYCGTIAYQIEHLADHQQRMWLREMIETDAHRNPLSADQKKKLLARLTEVFGFERFVQKAYLGQKSFSIEGLDATVPMLDKIIEHAAHAGSNEVVLGMAHRGRLSVLAHNLGRSPETIFAEFEGATTLEAITTIPSGGTGDVKYHHGAEGMYQTDDGMAIKARLYPNPSHLEFVDPVVTGATRAAQTEHSGHHLHHNPNAAVCVLLHGDAAFPGQGVVAETFNLQSLAGYTTGGTIHLITNNQVGFTTDPLEARSTLYASDLAKGYDVPIIHVNADDIEACISAVNLAMAYRDHWQRDVVIDLIGYRRYGHNEADEPAYTQPKMYEKVRKHPPVRDIYAERLIKEGVVTKDEADAMLKERQEELANTHKGLKARIDAGEFEEPPTGTGELDRSASPDVKTAVSANRLRSLNEELLTVPDSFTIHKKLRKPFEKRRDTLGPDGGIDWAQGEALAFASLLTEATPVRLTGQDSERGTFSQRHLAFHDEKTGLKYVPIQNLPGALAPFELHNSPLSEVSCLGFEYGYSAASPESLVVWEAQFGDFNNCAQVIADQFIVSGQAKWGQTSRLTLLLPHGYEGSGPEHSSARIERFLQLAAEGNIRVANPTTPAQYFHLLRRQARIAKPRPLVVFTPKSLLRNPRATSTLEDLAEGGFQFLIDDEAAAARAKKVKRLVLCSGKFYYDITGHSKYESAEDVAVVRVELLYPFVRNELGGLIESYPSLKEVVWAQEEPRNMGAWSFMQARLPELLPKAVELRYVGRPERASPSEGYPAAHVLEQERITVTALATGA